MSTPTAAAAATAGGIALTRADPLPLQTAEKIRSHPCGKSGPQFGDKRVCRSPAPDPIPCIPHWCSSGRAPCHEHTRVRRTTLITPIRDQAVACTAAARRPLPPRTGSGRRATERDRRCARALTFFQIDAGTPAHCSCASLRAGAEVARAPCPASALRRVSQAPRHRALVRADGRVLPATPGSPGGCSSLARASAPMLLALWGREPVRAGMLDAV
jgi:hypothetical protein